MPNQQNVIIGNYSFNASHAIGKGSTGNVYKGIRIVDGYPIAIKIINLGENQNQITRNLLQTQKKALKLMKSHPNVIKLLDIIQNEFFCHIITELYNGGTLKDYIRMRGRMNENEALKIFRQIVSGYCSVSDITVIHRDLKPANIMLKQFSLQPVIIDFGFCEVIQIQKVMRAFNVGSPSYMSPEAYQKTLYSEKSDIWSLGIIFYQMLTGTTLDDGMDIQYFFKSISEDFITKKICKFTGVCGQILRQILRIDSHERISCHKIKYILDKDAIFKLNKLSTQLSSSVQMGNTCNQNSKNRRPLIGSSITLQKKNNNQKNSNYQSLSFSRQSLGIMNNFNHSSNVSIFSNQFNFKAKLAESRYRQKVYYSPQNDLETKKQSNKSIVLKKITQIQFRNPINLQTYRTIPNHQQNIYRKEISLINNKENRLTSENNHILPNFISKQNSEIEFQHLAFKQKDLNRGGLQFQCQNPNKDAEICEFKNESLMPLGKENNLQLTTSKVPLNNKFVNPLSSNIQKFSFKKRAELNQNYNYQYQNLNVARSQQDSYPMIQQQIIMSKSWRKQNVCCVNLNKNLNHFGPSLQNNIAKQSSVILPSQNYTLEKSQKDQSSRHMLIKNNQTHNIMNHRMI